MLINGEPGLSVSALDRGLAYGDGAFETVRYTGHHLVLWPDHRQRLMATCDALKISLDVDALEAELLRVLANRNEDGVLKVLITRGAGGRGYKPEPGLQATRIVYFQALQNPRALDYRNGIKVIICQHRLSSGGYLAGMKHLNRLEQVMASMELVDGYDEGLMLDANESVIEGTRSNIFIARDGRLMTPALDASGVAGVMRDYLIRCFLEQGLAVASVKLSLREVMEADEVFMCNSVFGVWPVTGISTPDGSRQWSVGELVNQAFQFQDKAFSP